MNWPGGSAAFVYVCSCVYMGSSLFPEFQLVVLNICGML